MPTLGLPDVKAQGVVAGEGDLMLGIAATCWAVLVARCRRVGRLLLTSLASLSRGLRQSRWSVSLGSAALLVLLMWIGGGAPLPTPTAVLADVPITAPDAPD